MDSPPPTPPLSADYYRRHAVRVRNLASAAMILAIREHLQEVAAEYEQLAERVDNAAPSYGIERR